MSGARESVRDAVSAGGVVWRRAGSEVEVVICGRGGERLWVLPKGTPDVGEAIEQTALREVREETGLDVRLGERLPSINYWFVAEGIRYHKFVHHWLMEPVGGDTDSHDAEFDEVVWVSANEARRRLTYANERRVLDEATRVLGRVP